MTKFLLGYHGGAMPDTPTEGEKVVAAWNSWMGGLGKSLVDGGNPAGAAKTVLPGGKIADGGGANPITGYSIVEAPSLADAVALSKNCPVLAAGGSVEVSELMALSAERRRGETPAPPLLFRGLRVEVEEPARLPLPELGIMPAAGQQFGMGPLLHDPSLLQHDEPVHRGDGGETMRDGDHGLAGHQP
jgi:hypothetical protein